MLQQDAVEAQSLRRRRLMCLDLSKTVASDALLARVTLRNERAGLIRRRRLEFNWVMVERGR